MIRYIYRFCVDLPIIYRGLIFLIAYDLGYTWQIIVVWLLIWGLYYQPPNRTVGHLEIMGKKKQLQHLTKKMCGTLASWDYSG